MHLLTIELPDELIAYVHRKVRELGLSGPSEFFEMLLRELMEREEQTASEQSLPNALDHSTA